MSLLATIALICAVSAGIAAVLIYFISTVIFKALEKREMKRLDDYVEQKRKELEDEQGYSDRALDA